MADLMRRYQGFPLGATDASVVTVAERLKVTEVATLDRRPFHAIIPAHTTGFDLLP